MLIDPRAVLILALAATIAETPSQSKRQSYPKSVKAALAAFEKVAEKPESVRQPKLAGLGRFVSPGITKTLLGELDRAQTVSYRTAVVRAIGRKKRDGVLPALLALFDDSAAAFSMSYSLANAIGKQGDAAVPELAKRLRNLPKRGRTKFRSQRNALLRSLGAAGTPAAYEVLIEAASEGTHYERYSALQNLSRAPKSEALTKLRVAALDSTYDSLRFEALNQLVAVGYPGVKAAALKIYKDQKKSTGSSYYATRLANAFAALLAPDTFEPFVVTAATGYQVVDRLLTKVGQKIDSYPGFTDWLLANGLKRKVPSERIVTVRLLTQSKSEEVGEALLKLVSSRDPGMSILAIRALGERGDQRAVPFLRRAMKSKDPAKKLDALAGLHALLKKEPAWRDELVAVLRGSDVQERVLAMDLLAEMQAKDLLPDIHKNFTHKAWTVRAAAYDFCRLVRSLESVSPLIERVDVEKGRLREDCLDALKAITSYRLLSGDRWRSWWNSSKATFKMPTLEQALPKRKSRSGAATVSSFFDIPLVSTKVIFVMDISGSMSAEVGTISRGARRSKGPNTRIEEAKRQLSRVVTDLPKEAVFNLIYFESRVHSLAKKSKKATKKSKAAALKSVAQLKATGGTNIHDALKLAFEDQGIDTIYLLSDGSPSAGKITDPNALATEVARWNQTRRIRIHTISIGSKSRFMERLAKESGGVHSHVN